MQIVEKKSEGLSRTWGVVIAAAELAGKLDAKIEEMRPQIQLKGFRPGKVPAAHIKKMYGRSLMGDLLNETVEKSVQQAVGEANVRLASSPEVSNLGDLDQVVAGAADLAFDIQAEIMPTFEPVGVEGIELSRPVYAVSDAEVEEALERLASENKTYADKKGKAADGDQLTIDFVGSIDGVEFEGGKGEDAAVVIGSGRFIPGFEEQLIGAKKGEERTLEVTFPEDYPVATLAGKAASFAVTVKAVQAPAETVVDDEFATKLGLSSLDALKDALRTNLQREIDGLSRARAKRRLLDVLDTAHSFDLPAKMVDEEFATIWTAVEQDRARGEIDPEDAGKSEDEVKGDYRKIAERRVRLGLVLAEIGQRAQVEVTDMEVSRAVQMEAMRYPGQERQVMEFFRQNAGAIARVRAPIFEEKVVDHILSVAKVTDVPVSRAELEADEDAAPAPPPAAPAPKPKKKAAKAETAEEPAAEAAADAAPAKKKAAPKKKAADAE